jgi:aminopeptidase-like protein
MPERTEDIAALFDRLWPLPRSLSGDGVRRTHDILAEYLPLERWEVASGTRVFDWTVPNEWRVRAAYVVTPDGRRILDFADCNLHLVGYSMPFRGRLARAELDAHLHSRPDLPDAIPYVTSYYARRWGFCIADDERRRLPEGEYEVVVDTELFDGHVTLSEAVLPGESDREILFSCYTCHPSLANDDLTGAIVQAFLYRRLAALEKRRFTYRFVFLPETIGSLIFLGRRGEHLREKLAGGIVVTNLGRPEPFRYKQSRNGDTPVDHVVPRVLAAHGWPHEVERFAPVGSDERQYCSPGFDLPVGVLSRGDTYYREYHTSLDNRGLIRFEAMREAVDALAAICAEFEGSRWYRNLEPYGEPQLGPRGLYHSLGLTSAPGEELRAMMWVLNLSDGRHDLGAIAARSGIDGKLIRAAAERAHKSGLLTPL